MSECIAKARRKIQYDNYMAKHFLRQRKNLYLESENQDLNDEKESNEINIGYHEKNKANTFSNFKINNIYSESSEEELKHNINNKFNNKNFIYKESPNFETLSKKKDLNSDFSSTNNNINKGKNSSQINKKYYHVIIGTSDIKNNKDTFWTIYKKNRNIKNNKLNNNYFHEKRNSLFNITSSNICINNNKN